MAKHKKEKNKNEKKGRKEEKKPNFILIAGIALIALIAIFFLFLAPKTQTFKETNNPICYENGKPIIRMYSTSWCPHCKWIRQAFDSNIMKYVNEGKIVARHWELDTFNDLLTAQKETSIPPAEFNTYQTFSPDGSIPAFVFGCKYYRIGNGYENDTTNGLQKESDEFNAIIEKLLATKQ